VAGLAVLAWTVPVRPAYLLMTPLFAVLVVSLAARPRGRSVLGFTPLVLLGEASYALYLLHLPLVRILEISGVQDGLLGWAWLGLVTAVSIPVFLYYETPLRRIIRKRLSASTATIATVPR
jgi:peptidoglycan/LPS O-acetylase OafA/YrhL